MTTSEEFFSPPDVRVFIQRGPTRPGAEYEYLGTGETSETSIKRGAKTIVRRQSRTQRGAWDVIGKRYAPPETHSTGIHMLMPRQVASFLEEQIDTGCECSIQLVLGKCNTADEFNIGWESKLLYEAADLEELRIPPMPSVDGGKLDEVYIDGTMAFEFYARILPVRFGEKAGSTVVAEVLDGLYAGPPSCGDCGPYNTGSDHLYALTRANAGSPGLSSQLVYCNDGATFQTVDIPTLGGLGGNKMAAAGDFLIVVSEAKRNLQYARRVTSIVASDWVSVTTGFVAAHGPRAIWAKNPAEVFIAGQGGYIYKATDFKTSVSPIEEGTLSSENYNAIHGRGSTFVAVGDNNTVVSSSNNGESIQLISGPLAGSDLQAVCVLDDNNWIVGGDGGAFYRTADAGTSWVAIPFSRSGVGAIIHDIRHCAKTRQVLYMCVEVGGRGYVFRSTDGGSYWTDQEPAVRGLAANTRLRFVAPSPNSVNVVATGGLSLGGTDGFLAIGA